MNSPAERFSFAGYFFKNTKYHKYYDNRGIRKTDS